MSDDEQALRLRAKAELRQRMRSLRRATPAEARTTRSAAIAERVVALDEYRQARVIAGYVSVLGEADPASVLERARLDGKLIALPRIDDAGALVLHRWEGGQPLVESTLGIPETFDLMFDADKSIRTCHLVWHKEKQLGVEFDDAAMALTNSA